MREKFPSVKIFSTTTKISFFFHSILMIQNIWLSVYFLFHCCCCCCLETKNFLSIMIMMFICLFNRLKTHKFDYEIGEIFFCRHEKVNLFNTHTHSNVLAPYSYADNKKRFNEWNSKEFGWKKNNESKQKRLRSKKRRKKFVYFNPKKKKCQKAKITIRLFVFIVFFDRNLVTKKKFFPYKWIQIRMKVGCTDIICI